MSSRPVQLRPSLHVRIETIEQERARDREAHALMADQVKEMYEVFDLTRKVFRWLNRAWVKISAAAIGVIGGLAALLTVIEKARQLLGH
jgi:hypothetical protein